MLLKNRIIFTYTALFSILTWSCSFEPDDANPSINTSDEFKIDMYQDSELSQSGIILEISTFEEYSCLNYDIETIQSSNNDIFQIELSKILTPEVCNDGQGPAIKNIPTDLELFSKQKLHFVFNDEIYDEATLSDKGSVVELELASNYGIKSYISTLHKIPSESLTCIFEYSTESLTPSLEKKILNLKNIVPETTLPSGYYGYFLVENGIIKPKLETGLNSTAFYFDLSGLIDTEKVNLANLIEEIEINLNPNIKFEYFLNL